jgi:hypothetical protein
MAQQRTVNDKIADARMAYNVFRDELTDAKMRQVVADMTDAKAEIAAKGDFTAYAGLVQASIQMHRVVAANDRAALMAAVMATQSGVTRLTADVTEGNED